MIMIRLYTPADLVGRLIASWLDSSYSHAGIEIDGETYHATFPRVRGEAPPSRVVTQPPRGGTCLYMSVPDEGAEAARAWCRSMVGTHYDVFAVFGWIFHARWMDRPDRVYCFELVYDALAVAGVFRTSRRLVTGEQLLLDCLASGLVMNRAAPQAARNRARRQKRPVIVSAPRFKKRKMN